ncbi:rab guanine nucleotide exchange factor S2 [Hypoxylon texense]
MSICQDARPPSNGSDDLVAPLTRENTNSAVESPYTVKNGNIPYPVKAPPKVIRGQPGSIEYPPSPPEQTLSPPEEAPTDGHLTEPKESPLAESQDTPSTTKASPVVGSPIDESLALDKYRGIMATWIYSRIIRYLENCLTDWPLDVEGRRSASAWLGNKLRSVILMDGRKYSMDQLLIYEKFLDCQMLVTNEDLQRVMSVCPWNRFPAAFAKVIKSGYILYIRSWSFTPAELDELVLHLRDEEKTFQELKQWKRVAERPDLEPECRLTIRYIGSCKAADWPHGPFSMKYDEFSKPFAGVLAEFLPAVERLFPRIAASAETHCIIHTTALGRDESKLQHKYTLAAMLPLFGYSTLINRFEDIEAALGPLELLSDSHFAALDTNFHYRAIELGIICHDELLFHLQSLFTDMAEYVSEILDTTSMELDVTTKFDTFRVQSTPYLFQGRETIMVLAGKYMDVNDYIHGRSFFNSESADALLMKGIIQGLAGVENMIASHFELFPYYCLAPGPFRDDLETAEVTFGRYMGEITAKRFTAVKEEDRDKPDRSGSTRAEDYLHGVGRFNIVELGDGLAFIHIPLLDPGRYRYAAWGKAKSTVRKFMQLSMQFVMLVADTAMQVLEDAFYHDNLHDLKACRLVEHWVRAKLDEPEGRRFRDDLNYAHKQLLCVSNEEPLMFA